MQMVNIDSAKLSFRCSVLFFLLIKINIYSQRSLDLKQIRSQLGFFCLVSFKVYFNKKKKTQQ